MENNEHIELMKEYVSTRDRVASKHIKYFEIVDKDFDNGFGRFLFERIDHNEPDEIIKKLDMIHNTHDKMCELVNIPNSLTEIEENAKEYIRLSKEVEIFYDKVFDYYEQYNLL